MIETSSIKLVVWDLDDTFWQGTLSEGSVTMLAENIKLLKDLTDCGIVNSVCSKNNYEQTKEILEKDGLWEYFVFPSISWESKGPLLKEKLDKMALRSSNTLFIDDNPSNLGEAKHYLPDIQIGGPEILDELRRQIALLERKDTAHKRLKQYKLLEKKEEVSKTYESSEDFLYDSHIQAVIHKDCKNCVQRLFELIQRTNQLNFTKKRISLDDLECLLGDSCYDCGYITVKDRFGDYGIVGFYALKRDLLEHFLFSCRTMGMGIEQWVYGQLGFPIIEVVGEVRTQLREEVIPGWINQAEPGKVPSERAQDETQKVIHGRFLLKGPCDMSHSRVYIKNSDLFESELTYVTPDGRTIDTYNHSIFIEGLKTYSEAEKQELAQDCPFIDPDMFKGSFFSKRYDVIFLSTLIESSYLIYQNKQIPQIKVVCGGPDLTDPDNWDDIINGRCYTGGNSFSKNWLQSFSGKYQSIGMTSPEMYSSFLSKCLVWLPKQTTLCLILGATSFFEGDDAQRIRHQELNDAVKSLAIKNSRIKYIELDDCIHGVDDFSGGLNHFSAQVYFELAQSMLSVIRDVTGREVSSYSSTIVLFDRIVLWVRSLMTRHISSSSRWYRRMKQVYNRIYKSR